MTKGAAAGRPLTEEEKNMSMDDIFKQIPGHNITLTLGGLEEGDEVFFKFRETAPIKINIVKAKDGRNYSFTPENQKQKLSELHQKDAFSEDNNS